jgi:ectoine hydroxylase-related dioxygenase (phytanoyl-CoA dioxygenase family)
MTLKKYFNEIDRNGIVIIRNLITENKIKKIKNKLEKILEKRNNKKKFVGTEDNQILWNYFFDDKSLLSLLNIPLVDRILQKFLDANYVLQSSVAQSRSFSQKNLNTKKRGNLGTTWHTDSRYLNKKRISKGFSYLVIIALDDFTKNSGTKYIPTSLYLDSKPKRSFTKSDLKKLKPKTLIMKAGSVCVMDTGIYHKAGQPGPDSRWSIFSIYTGWFVKPYFNYKKIFKKFKMRDNLKKILHFYSDPPEIDNVRPVLTKNFDE